jgi:hypothetical protein
MNDLMNVEENSLINILKAYVLHLSNLESEDKLYSQQKQHQPAARYESDFFANIDANEVLALYRNDYICDVNEDTETKDLFEVNELTKADTTSCDSNLVDEMRLLLSDEQTIDDIELLRRLDNYLEKSNVFHKSNALLKSSISQSALSLYIKEKSSSDSACMHPAEAMLTGNDEKKIVKRVRKRDRKEINDTISPPPDVAVKKFRRRRRFGILGMSNAEMAAAAKAAAAGTNFNTSTRVNSAGVDSLRSPITRRQTLSSSQSTKQPADTNDLKWIIRGGTKTAKGNTHPSDILRALMNDLEEIGIGMKGFDIERKILKIQKNHNICIRSIKDDSKLRAEKTKDGSNYGGEDRIQNNNNIEDDIEDDNRKINLLNNVTSLSSVDKSYEYILIKAATKMTDSAPEHVSMDEPTKIFNSSTLSSGEESLGKELDEGSGDYILLPMKESTETADSVLNSVNEGGGHLGRRVAERANELIDGELKIVNNGQIDTDQSALMISESSIDLDNKGANEIQNLIEMNGSADTLRTSTDPLSPILLHNASSLPCSSASLSLSSSSLPPPSLNVPLITSSSHVPFTTLNTRKDFSIKQPVVQSLKGYEEGGKRSVSRSASAVSYG